MLTSNPPIALSLAKSNSKVIALMPKLSYEKYKFKKVGIDPKNIPVKKIILNILSDLSKWYKRKGERPNKGTNTIKLLIKKEIEMNIPEIKI